MENYNRPKVEVMAEMIKEINPNCNIEIFNQGVQEDNVQEFLHASTVVLDCIDFFCLSARKTLQAAAYESGLPIFLAAPMGFSGTLIGFEKPGPSFSSYLNLKEEDDEFDQLMKFLIGVAPKALHRDYVDFSVERIVKMQTGPSIASAVSLGVGLLSTEVILRVLNKRLPLLAPRSVQFDAYHLRFAKNNILGGNKNILQRLKLKLASKMYGDQRSEFLKFIK